jgi:hypothetical protein
MGLHTAGTHIYSAGSAFVTHVSFMTLMALAKLPICVLWCHAMLAQGGTFISFAGLSCSVVLARLERWRGLLATL